MVLSTLYNFTLVDINEFADQSDEEIDVSYIEDDKDNNTASCQIISEKNFPNVFDAKFPNSFDWRSKGVVTKVKDQKNCDAGYAFALVGKTLSPYVANVCCVDQVSVT